MWEGSVLSLTNNHAGIWVNWILLGETVVHCRKVELTCKGLNFDVYLYDDKVFITIKEVIIDVLFPQLIRWNEAAGREVPGVDMGTYYELIRNNKIQLDYGWLR